MKKTCCSLLVVFIGLFAIPGQAATVSVKNLRLWRAPDHTRLVLDLSGPLEHRLFVLKNPHRIVIDMERARLADTLPKLDFSGPVLANVRTGAQSRRRLRMVFDLKRAVRPRTLVLKPAGQYGHRLVIDLYFAADEKKVPKYVTKATARPSIKHEVVIAVDAGHGGDDPGAIGRRYRTKEKHVVLAIAREVKRRIDATPGMRAVLTRRGDYFISLRRRMEIAKRNGADIFISIHADYMPGRRGKRIRGSSVYALSRRGATNETARILANKENASDLIGGSIAYKDKVLNKVIIDLLQTGTITASLKLGADVLASLKRVGPLHQNTVSQAGFTVLRSPQIPSLLIETAFLSNPGEERKLRSRSYRRRIARGIVNGLRRYIARGDIYKRKRSIARQKGKGPVVVAKRARIHVVRRGDTLIGISKKYKVDVAAIRFANNLNSNRLNIGLRLVIP